MVLCIENINNAYMHYIMSYFTGMKSLQYVSIYNLWDSRHIGQDAINGVAVMFMIAW